VIVSEGPPKQISGNDTAAPDLSFGDGPLLLGCGLEMVTQYTLEDNFLNIANVNKLQRMN
jgi:hypothetical protein